MNDNDLDGWEYHRFESYDFTGNGFYILFQDEPYNEQEKADLWTVLSSPDFYCAELFVNPSKGKELFSVILEEPTKKMIRFMDSNKVKVLHDVASHIRMQP